MVELYLSKKLIPSVSTASVSLLILSLILGLILGYILLILSIAIWSLILRGVDISVCAAVVPWGRAGA